MAKPTTARAKRFFVRISDRNSPPQFVAPCGFKGWALNQSKNLSEIEIPDCDPDQTATVERDTESRSWEISGEGVLSKEAHLLWQEAFDEDDSIECEVEIVYPDQTSELWTGFFIIDSYNLSRSDGTPRVTASISMKSDGAVVHARPT